MSVVNTGVLHATVLGPGGAPAAGYVVTVVNRAQGPFSVEGVASSYTGALTAANGTTTISGLPVPGDYCVLARPLTSLGTATSFGTFMAPLTSSNAGQLTPPAHALGGIWAGNDGKTAPLNPENFQAYCYQGSTRPPTLVLTSASPSASAQLNLQPAGTLQVQFLDLNGQPTNAGAWVLQGILPPPWMQDFTLPAGLRPGLLLSAGPANGGVVLLDGIPRGPVTVESEILNLPGQGQLTFTLRLNSTGGNQVIPPIMLEPLLCALNRHPEATGDASGPVDFRGPVKDGFRADFGPPLTRRNELGLLYAQSAGEATLDLRLWLGTDDYHVIARYRYAGGQGSITQLSGNGLALGVHAAAFFAPQSNGTVHVTWSITGLPGALTAVDYNLSTAGDQFPELVKGRKAFQAIAIPASCTGGQSNDDQWWLN